jgi:hypothetical protein
MDGIIISPLQTREAYQALVQAHAWSWHQRRVDWRHELILALDGGQIVGFCAIEVDQPRERGEIVLVALESRQPGAGWALLHALKAPWRGSSSSRTRR